MRDILVEHARRQGGVKRGSGRRRTGDGCDDLRVEPPHENILDLDRALSKLEQESPERAHVVQLRFFTGLSHRETADILGVSLPTVERRWRYSRAWLRRELSSTAPEAL
jgi:RNA polymerase sigma factor (TIGR02999 family)